MPGETPRLRLVGSFSTLDQCLEGARELLRQGVGLHEIRVMASGPYLKQPPLTGGWLAGPAEGALIGAVAAGFAGGLLSVLDPAFSGLDALALAIYSVLFGGIAGGLVVTMLHWLRGRAAAPSQAPHAGAEGFHLLLDDDGLDVVAATGRTSLVV